MKKDKVQKAANALKNLMTIPYPSLGIDLDGCVDEAPIFFSLLTSYWPGDVYVITYRSDRQKAQEELTKYNIRYKELILVDSFEEKAKVIESNGILVYFDDQPEMLKEVSSMVNVMLVRNGGNFDFEEKLWIFSEKTGRMV